MPRNLYTPGRGKIVPRNLNNLTARRKGLQRFWLHPRDCYHAVTQTYNNCAETHLVQKLPVVRHRSSARSGSVSLRKGSRRFCPHRSDRCRVLMLTCRNSPLWQRCECCNNVLSSFWPPWLDQLHGHHVTCALIGTSCKLAAYNYTSNLALWTTLEHELVSSNEVCQGIQKVRVEPATRSAVATLINVYK